MAYTFPTEAEVIRYALAHFQNAFTDPVTGKCPPLGPRSYLGQSARAFAGCIVSVLEAKEACYNDAAPSLYVDSAGVTKTLNSSAALDRWAYIFGLPSNRGSGIFGRNANQVALGGGAVASGTPALSLTTPLYLTDLSGQVQFKLRSGVTLGGGGTANVIIDAVTAGESGNLDAGVKLRWQSPPVGLDTEIELVQGLDGGLDEEDDVALARRLIRFLQSPPEGGTLADWRRWTEATLDASGRLIGVKRAYLFKVKGGTGSVTITPDMGGTGQNRKPTPQDKANIEDWLATLHIATDTPIVELPWFPGEPLSIFVVVRPAPGMLYDWSDTGSPATVSSGTGTSLVLGSLPAALQAAIDSGREPRIQLSLPASSPLPFQARVLSRSSLTLTLDTALPSSPAGVSVYAGGPPVLPVAVAILDYINNVGPSRASGYADASDDWEDAVTISRIAQVAIDARDPSGNPVVMLSRNVGAGSPVGVQIDVDGAGYTGEDYQLRDIGLGPQLPECAAIIVRGGA